MKNIQVIDNAANSIFEIYQVPDDLFHVVFPNETDVAFIDEVERAFEARDGKRLWSILYQHPVNKKQVNGIQGTLHLTGSPVDKSYFPTRKEAEVIRNKIFQRPRRLTEKSRLQKNIAINRPKAHRKKIK